jgi:hypothetical protein
MGGQLGNAGMPTTPPNYNWIVVPIEIRGKMKQLGKFAFEIDHRWGKHAKFIWPTVGAPIQINVIAQNSPAKEFEKQFKTKEKEKAKEVRWVTAADWALRHGLVKEFHATMEEFKKVEPKHAAVVNYTRVQNALKKPFGSDDPAAEGLLQDLAEKNFRKVPDESGHYVVLTNLPPNPQNEALVKRRLKSFDEVVENFYYWFAIQTELPQPEFPKHRLAVLLTSDAEEHHDKLARWGFPVTLNGAFSSRRDNLVVLSARRFDEAFTNFEKANINLWSGVKLNREELISGAVWDRPEGKNPQYVATIAGLQMLAITQKAMEEDVQRAAFTHEGVRQLLLASGIAPRNVAVPDWYLSGFASFFETSNLAPYAGFGVPSWTNLITFKHCRKQGKLGKAPGALMDVLTDKHFRDAQRTHLEMQDATADKEALFDQYREELEMARSSSWAFVYYLAKTKKFGKLLKYGQELNNLPRDLDLEDQALQAAFARAFAPSDSKNPGVLDPSWFPGMAAAWYADLDQTILEVPEVETEYSSIFNNRKKESESSPVSNGPTTSPGINPGSR